MKQTLSILCLTLISSNVFGIKTTDSDIIEAFKLNPTPAESFFNIKQTNPASEKDFFAPHFSSHEITPEQDYSSHENSDAVKNNKISYFLGNQRAELSYQRKISKSPASFTITSAANIPQIIKIVAKGVGKKKIFRSNFTKH